MIKSFKAIKTSLFFFILLIGCLFTGCSKQKPTETQPAWVSERKKIDSLENLLREAYKLDEEKQIYLNMRTIQAMNEYAVNWPEDTITPTYLFKRAQLFETGLHDPAHAAELYRQLFEKYQNFKQRPMAVFLAATAWHEAGDTTRARQTIEYFLARYPEHVWRKDAEALQKLMRSSPDGIKKHFDDLAKKAENQKPG